VLVAQLRYPQYVNEQKVEWFLLAIKHARKKGVHRKIISQLSVKR